MNALNTNELQILSKELGYKFKNEQILIEALTHRSYAKKNNERMEFLGDAILGFIISDWLFKEFIVSEGELTRIRAKLVCKETLAAIAKKLKLGDYIRLGTGELKTGGHQRESILADTLEAIIGAIFLDAGIEPVKACILIWFKEALALINSSTKNKDAKTLLQEYLQSKKYPIPEYNMYAVEGNDHEQIFFIECKIALLKEPVTASASSRKKAEQECATKILALLEQKI